MNRLTDSFTRRLVAALLAASSLGPAVDAVGARATTSDDGGEVDQLGLARQAIARGDNAEALSRYVRVLATRPRDLTALIGAGNAAVELGDFSAGLAFFGRAEEVDSRNGRVKAGLASALAQTEQPGAALKLFDEAVALGVPEEEIAGDRGLAWDLRGNPRRAQRDYATALAHKPADHEVTMRLALSQAISGDRETALRTLGPWLDKQDQGAWRTRAFVLAIAGDTKGAAQAANAVLPQAQADAMAPFFAKLASLNSAQQAMAANFGYLPGDKTKPGQRSLPPSTALAATDSRSAPTPASRGSPSRSSARVSTKAVENDERQRLALATVPATPVAPPVAPARPVMAMVAAPIAKAPPAQPAQLAQLAKPAAAPPRQLPFTTPAIATTTARPSSPAVSAEAVPMVATGGPSPSPSPMIAERPVKLAAATPPAAPARAPTIVTISEAELAELQAQTAADAEAEARADAEMSGPVRPAIAPRSHIAAAPAKPVEPAAKPVEARPKLLEAAKRPLLPLATADARPALPEAPTKVAETRPKILETPARVVAARAKPVVPMAKLAEVEPKPVEPAVKIAEAKPKLEVAPARTVEPRARPVESPVKIAEAQPRVEAPAKAIDVAPAKAVEARAKPTDIKLATARTKAIEPPTKPVEARIKPAEATSRITETPTAPTDVKLATTRPKAKLVEAQAKPLESQAKTVKIRAKPTETKLAATPSKVIEAAAEPVEAYAKRPEAQARSVEVRAKPAEAPVKTADLRSKPEKAADARARAIAARLAEPGPVPPELLAVSRPAKATRVAQDESLRPAARGRPLPISREVARSFGALPHGSALSADATVATGPAAARPLPKRVDLAVNDDDQAATKPRRLAAGDAKADLADKDGPRVSRESQAIRDAKAAREAKLALASQSLKEAQAARAIREAQAAKDAKAASDARAAQVAKDAQALKDAQAAKTARAAQALKDAKAAREAKAAQAARDAASLKEAQAAQASQAARDSKAAREAREAQAARDKSAKAALADAAVRPRTGERYWVQVAGGANKGDLNKSWARLKAGPAGAVLKGKTPLTTPLNATNRLLVGPFADKDEAQGFINKLSSQGTSSFHFVSSSGQKVDKLQDK